MFEHFFDVDAFLVMQDSFYRGLTPEESKHVHEYNFDHPGNLVMGNSIVRHIKFVVLVNWDELSLDEETQLEHKLMMFKFMCRCI